MQMKNWRDIFAVVGWAGLIWILISRAIDGIVSEVFWIDLLYNVGTMTFVIAFVIGFAVLIGRFVNLAMPFFAGVLILAIIAGAAIEHYWLRDIVARLLQTAG